MKSSASRDRRPAGSTSATACCATKIVHTGLDSAARLVMADSTNLSLGPNATLKLDRTVFNDEHSYRDIAIGLTTGAFRFVTGHSEKTAYKITTPLATIGVRGTTLDILSERSKTTVVLQDGASRGLHAELSMRRADPARRYRRHHLGRRQGHDQEDQHPALDFRRDLRGRGGALHRHAICRCRRRSTTAAIPPACCAGADDGKIHAQSLSLSAALTAAISLVARRSQSRTVALAATAACVRRRLPCRPNRRRRTIAVRSRSAHARPPTRPTGADSSGGSIGDLAKQRFNQMITNRVLGTVLLGVNEQVNCSDCVSAFGSAGSFSAGIHGRKEITPNLSLLAGIAYTQYSEGGYSVTSAPIGAFALRYDFVDWGSSRPFFDVGTILSPFEKVRYSRSYMTQPRRGVADQLDQQQQLRRLWQGGLDQPALAARRGRRLGRGLAVVAAGRAATRIRPPPRSIRSTPRSRPAPIEPISSRSADNGRICSAAASKANINGGYVQSFATHSGIVATVTGDGTVVPTIGNQGWFEYGGRLGFRITKGWVADLFVNGTAGPAAGRQHHSRRRRAAGRAIRPVPLTPPTCPHRPASGRRYRA